MIEKAKQANRYGMNSKLATAAKIREMLLSDEFLDALAKRISYKSGIWVPKVGDKVKVNRPGRIADGKVGVIVEDDAAEYVVRVDSENLTSRNLKCEDLEPAWAETANPSETPNSSIPDPLNCIGNICDLAESTGVTCPVDSCDLDTGCRQAPADHIPDANKKLPPTGYRLLDKSAKVEPRKSGDLFWSLTLGDWKALSAESEQDANRDDWPACRKIEQPAKDPETIARYDSDGRDVTELAGLWAEGDTQYREPTQADLANGPIEVEVCDNTNCDTNWEKRQLYAILPIKCMFPYIVGAGGDGEFTQSWKHARVKVR